MIEQLERRSTFTRSQEDYLKALYQLHGDQRPVPTRDLAQRLGISSPSVSEMVTRLTAQGLVEHVISERMEQRIFELLGRPELDPHGHAIPSVSGKVRSLSERPLSECRA